MRISPLMLARPCIWTALPILLSASVHTSVLTLTAPRRCYLEMSMMQMRLGHRDDSDGSTVAVRRGGIKMMLGREGWPGAAVMSYVIMVKEWNMSHDGEIVSISLDRTAAGRVME